MHATPLSLPVALPSPVTQSSIITDTFKDSLRQARSLNSHPSQRSRSHNSNH